MVTDKKAYLKQIQEVINRGPYKADWASLTDMELPGWFKKAKFGIFIHWGLYSVPAYANEWYSRNMYLQGTREFEHHVATYGPHKDFGYKDFIPMFTADKFNPDEWADLFQEAGANYVVPVAEHHDGFQMYASGMSKFNAANMGPKRNVLGELKQAFEKRGMLFATSTHRAEHLWFMGIGREFDSDIKEPLTVGDFYWPSLKEQPNMDDMFASPYPTEEFLTDWLLRTCELIDDYKPRILYFDWWIQHEGYKETLKQIAAYYYNRGVEWGTPVAICYKHDAMAFGSGIVDVERGKFADTKPYYWQTDTAIAKNSWCYTTELEYKTPYEILCYLIDVVSKNGNLLLNVGPKSDGTIPEEDTRILKEIGAWLKVNGEAIYNSKPWRTPAEGPTKEAEGKFSEGQGGNYTREDFRFTVGHGCIYATCLSYPEDGTLLIRSLAKTGDANGTAFQGILDKVEILGYNGTVSYEQTADGLIVHGPKKWNDYPVVVKVHTN
ncbi:MAG: alpha-L-fucosidase [Lachnospiraceae bacterium]